MISTKSHFVARVRKRLAKCQSYKNHYVFSLRAAVFLQSDCNTLPPVHTRCVEKYERHKQKKIEYDMSATAQRQIFILSTSTT